jgi:hypothetical protein
LREGDVLLEMPCDFRHRLHEHCARTWLSRSANCPLCRVDVRTRLPAVQANATRLISQTTPDDLVDNAAPAQGVRTRDGGIVIRFESTPPSDWERPVYIPTQLWHLAQYFEVSYPGVGAAHVWRVPALSSDPNRADGGRSEESANE